MKRLLLAVFLVGCGGGGFEPDFEGTWRGTTTVSVQGFAPLAYSSALSIVVNGGELSAFNICPAGDGSIGTHGEGDTAVWSGAVTCNPVATTACSAVAIVFQAATLDLLTSNNLTAQGSGRAIGCGTSANATMIFNGSK
jgi:hypothetical protein